MTVEDASVFDSAEAFERVDNDKELFFELVDMFFEDYEEVIKGIEQAITSQESKPLEERAHSIKSALGNLGAMQAFNLALSLEKSGREESVDGVSGVFEQLKASVAAFKEEADKHR